MTRENGVIQIRELSEESDTLISSENVKTSSDAENPCLRLSHCAPLSRAATRTSCAGYPHTPAMRWRCVRCSNASRLVSSCSPWLPSRDPTTPFNRLSAPNRPSFCTPLRGSAPSGNAFCAYVCVFGACGSVFQTSGSALRLLVVYFSHLQLDFALLTVSLTQSLAAGTRVCRLDTSMLVDESAAHAAASLDV